MELRQRGGEDALGGLGVAEGEEGAGLRELVELRGVVAVAVVQTILVDGGLTTGSVDEDLLCGSVSGSDHDEVVGVQLELTDAIIANQGLLVFQTQIRAVEDGVKVVNEYGVIVDECDTFVLCQIPQSNKVHILLIVGSHVVLCVRISDSDCRHLHSVVFQDADLRFWSFIERENKELGF